MSYCILLLSLIAFHLPAFPAPSVAEPCPDYVSLAREEAEQREWQQWRGPVWWFYNRPELTRFPTSEEAGFALNQNAEFRKLAVRKSLLWTEDPGHWWEAVKESDRARRAWYHLCHAWTCRYDDEAEHLQTLRSILGEEDFWKGKMPYPVPVRYLESIP